MGGYHVQNKVLKHAAILNVPASHTHKNIKIHIKAKKLHPILNLKHQNGYKTWFGKSGYTKWSHYLQKRLSFNMSQHCDAGTLKKKKNLNYRLNSTVIGWLIVSHCINAIYLQYNKNYIYSEESIINIQILRNTGTFPKNKLMSVDDISKFLSRILVYHYLYT